jgi:hypothetical protein
MRCPLFLQKPDKLIYENREARKKFFEKLATGDKATIVLKRQSDGKMRVTSGPSVIFRDQLLEASGGDGRLHVPRKPDDGTRRSSATIRMARDRAPPPRFARLQLRGPEPSIPP